MFNGQNGLGDGEHSEFVAFSLRNQIPPSTVFTSLQILKGTFLGTYDLENTETLQMKILPAPNSLEMVENRLHLNKMAFCVACSYVSQNEIVPSILKEFSALLVLKEFFRSKEFTHS